MKIHILYWGSFKLSYTEKVIREKKSDVIDWSLGNWIKLKMKNKKFYVN